MKTRLHYLILLGLFLYVGCNTSNNSELGEEEVSEKEMTLIDREIFFGNPEKTSVRISPDGEYFSYLAPVNGVMNVWAGPLNNLDEVRPVTQDTLRGIRSYMWTYKPGHLLYNQDLGGDENFHVYLVDVEDVEVTDLTPYEKINGPDGVPMKGPDDKLIRPRANIMNVSGETPNEILVQMNRRNPSLMDVYKINLDNPSMDLVVEDEGFLQIVTDNKNNVRLASKTNPEGGQIVFKRTDSGWEEYFRVPQEDMLTFGIAGFDKSNEKVYIIDSRGRDKAALYKLDLNTDEKTLIAESSKADISNATQDPETYEIDAYAINYLTTEWTAISENMKEDLDYLTSVVDGEMSILNRTNDDNTWIVAYNAPDRPLQYYKYDRKNKKADYLLTAQPKLEDLPLSQTYPVEIKSRDGQTLVSYLTIPANKDQDGRPVEALPTVLLVHGGPWARDSYGFNSLHQWLANRGYAVLSVNYRGSTGFGKNFINIAAEEWAGKMHDDLIDAVDWMVEEGIADKEKVGIMGGSYGGYATLVGLTFTPDVFAAGVDIVGPSNLNTLISTIPPYWKAFRDVFVHHIGDPDTEEGLSLLEERSPLNKVDNISKPLLIGQGANDPRVKQSESDQIVEAMQQKAIPVTYVLYPDEGHGFARPENRLSFFAISEMFLAEHLGGRYQEIDDDFNNSSLRVVEAGGLEEELSDFESVMVKEEPEKETEEETM